MDFNQLFNDIVTGATLILDVALLAFVLSRYFSSDFYSCAIKFIREHAMLLVLLLSLASTLGALVYSNVIGYPACSLCLIQRIFMFPIPVVALVGLFNKKRSRTALKVIIILALGGVLASVYHFVKDMLALYMPTLSPLGCPDIKGVPSCDRIYILRFGYVTIPTIALTAFAWIMTFAVVGTKNDTKKESKK